MRFSEKVYRFLLCAYPRSYRDRYARPMEQLFRDQLREARTFPRLAWLWLRTLVDWSKTVITRHAEPIAEPAVFPMPAEPFKRCIYFALRETRASGQSEITLDHLLLGILREEPSLVSDEARLTITEVLRATQVKGNEAPGRDLPLSHETKRAWIAAAVFANQAGREKSAPRDLAAGILRESHTRAARLLREHMV